MAFVINSSFLAAIAALFVAKYRSVGRLVLKFQRVLNALEAYIMNILQGIIQYNSF